MIRYVLAAAALKMFSISPITRRAYRNIGNIVGKEKRKETSLDPYISRGDLLIRLLRKYGALRDGARFLEVGTGWMHWYGIYARLHADVRVDLFDVWDNRQFEALRHVFSRLETSWKHDASRSREVMERLEVLTGLPSIDALYREFNMNYRIDGSGSLTGYEDSVYDAVMSFHVLEHVPADSIRDTVANIFRTLKPGAMAIHQIGIDDHLSHYDPKESRKNYLRFSTNTWKRWFENVVQYHNRLQPAEHVEICRKVGFEVCETASGYCDIHDLKINPEWSRFSDEDLSATNFTLVLRKPPT
jgi:cyclopropane fatty-acyl-phospholipid synthase-like methyltransferase